MTSNKTTTFALTGVTGLLGRNLMLEIIKQNKHQLDNIRFIFFGRNSKTDPLKNRIIKILEEDLLDYLDDANFDLQNIYNWFEQNVKLIDYKLDAEKLAISAPDLAFLKQCEIDFFFHIAALTDLRNKEFVRENIEKTNVLGTKNLIELVKEIKKVGEFIYVGTAYSCGKTSGDIMPDYVNDNGQFRNHYEKSKLQAEILVRNFEKETGQKCRYFRPSVICGRMIEKELGAVNKFDVFYGWGAFFLILKKKYLKNEENLISSPCQINLRYQASPNSGLNIVPVDYCSKVIYQCCIQNYPAKHIHLTYHQEIPYEFFRSLILKSLNIQGTYSVDYYPQNQNKDEQLYYKADGATYAPYMTAEVMNFNVSNIEPLIAEHKIFIPNLLNDNNFNILLNYANQKKYGLLH